MEAADVDTGFLAALPLWVRTMFGLEAMLAYTFMVASLALYEYGLMHGTRLSLMFLQAWAQIYVPLFLFYIVHEYETMLGKDSPEAHVVVVIRMGLLWSYVAHWFTNIYQRFRNREFQYAYADWLHAWIVGVVVVNTSWKETKSGDAEWEYFKSLPLQLLYLCIYIAKTAPRVAYRYFILRDRAQGSVIEWWMTDDRMQQVVGNYFDDI